MTAEELGQDGLDVLSAESSDSPEPADIDTAIETDDTVSTASKSDSGSAKGAKKTDTVRDLKRQNKELLVRIRELELQRVARAEKNGTGGDRPRGGSARENDSASERGESIPLRRLFPITAPLRFGAHAACYYAGRMADKVVGLYSRAFKMDREYVADFNKSTGMAYARREQWESAIPLLEKALATAPDDLDTLLHLAEACNAVGEHEQACEHLEQALATNPDSAKVVRALGMIYARQQDYGRAIEYLEKAIELDPDHAETRYRLGAAYDNCKEYNKAVESFKKAIRINPRLAKAYQALGFTYETVGDREQAIGCFKKALELE